MNRDFKGVWIPKEIWLDKNLTVMEKMLFIEVDSLCGEQGCWATNQYLADFLQISKDRVSKLVSSLVKKGYFKVDLRYVPGTKQIKDRIIYVTIGYGRKQLEGVGENNYTPIVENAEENNTSINNTNNNNNVSASEKKENVENLEGKVVVDSLCALGVSQEQAIKLINDYGADSVKRRIHEVSEKKGINNAIGWLIAALKNNYVQIPTTIPATEKSSVQVHKSPVTQSQTQTIDNGKTRVMPLPAETIAYIEQCEQEYEISEDSPFKSILHRFQERELELFERGRDDAADT